MKLTEAYAYMRYSSHNQDDGWSIEAQKSAIQRYANANNIKVVKFFKDEACTGRNRNRNGYQSMISALENGDVKLVLVHKLDRFHRNTANQLADIKKLDKLGIRLIAIADGIDTADSSTNLIATIKAALSEQFSIDLSKETRKGLTEAAKSCLHCGGTPPFGFRVGEDKRLEIDETTAPAVKQIFDMYLAGMGYTSIIQWLHDSGYKTAKGKDFSKSAIYAMLKNEKYAGVFTYDKATPKDEDGKRNSHKYKENYIRIPGGCPAIVSEEDFQQVQEMMKNRSSTSRSYSCRHYYPLNGKLFAEDGVTRYGGNVNHSNGKRYFQYRCSKSNGSKAVNADSLNEAVMYTLRLLLISEDREEELLNELNSYAAEMMSESSAECRTLKNKKAALENSRNNLMAALESGKAKSSILNRLDAIEAEISEIAERIEHSAVKKHTFTAEDLKTLRKQFVPYMTTQKTLQAKNLLNAAVNKVTISNDDVEIRFNHGVCADSDTINYFLN